MAEPPVDVLAQYEKEIRLFTDAMRYKLRKNASKGKWENTTIPQIFSFMLTEILELQDAVERENGVDVLMECADIANLALIIADIAVKRGLEGVSKQLDPVVQAIRDLGTPEARERALRRHTTVVGQSPTVRQDR